MTLFGAASDIPVDRPTMPNIKPWPEKVRLQKEKDLVGLFFSGHPLDRYDRHHKHLQLETVADIQQTIKDLEQSMAEKRMISNIDDATFRRQVKEIRTPFRLIVQVESKRIGDDKNGNPYTIFYFSDKTAEDSSGIFTKNFYNYDKYIIPGRAILLEGIIESDYKSLGSFRMSTTKITPAEEILKTVCNRLEIDVKSENLNAEIAQNLVSRMVKTDESPTKIRINLVSGDDEPLSLVTSRLHIAIDEELIKELEEKEDLVFKIY